jgi:hypothetical protein
MRYRRENKKMVEKLKTFSPEDAMDEKGNNEMRSHRATTSTPAAAFDMVDRQAKFVADAKNCPTGSDEATQEAAAAAAVSSSNLADPEAVEAAVAVAETFGKTTMAEAAAAAAAELHPVDGTQAAVLTVKRVAASTQYGDVEHV